MNSSRKIRREYAILIMACLVLSAVICGRAIAGENRKTIRSVVIRASGDGKTLLDKKTASQDEMVSVEVLKKYKDIGVNYITVYSAAFWGRGFCEKEPGKYDFSLLGKTLDNVRKAGLKAIVRTGAHAAPDWVWTYGKKEPVSIQFDGNTKVPLDKISVYPMMNPEGKAVYTYEIVDPWDVRGNFLKCRYIARICSYMHENYSDVVEYVDAGNLTEGIWAAHGGRDSMGRMYTPTWAPTALDSYRRYLQEIYGDDEKALKHVNTLYNTNWKSFWEAVPPKTYENTKYFQDWFKWYERGMVILFEREASIIRRAGFKVNAMAHFVSTDDSPGTVMPTPEEMIVPFLHPERIGLVDADLYVLGPGYSNITWRVRDGSNFWSDNNPLVMVNYPGKELMDKIRKERPDALFIMEDWEYNPFLGEYIGLCATILDGFQIMQGTIEHQYPAPRRSPAEMFEEFKDAIRTFWLLKQDKSQ